MKALRHNSGRLPGTLVFTLALSGSAWGAGPVGGDIVVNRSVSDFESRRELVNGISKLLDRVDERLESRQVRIRTFSWSWDELEHFEGQIWRAMALDPARLDSKYIPDGLDPVEITRDLRKSLSRLKASSSVAKTYGAENEFNDYVAFCEELIGLREQALYRQARLLAKKGLLEQKFQTLTGALEKEAQTSMELSVRWADEDRKIVAGQLISIRKDLSTLKERIQPSREPASVEALHQFQLIKRFAVLVLVLVFATGFLGGWLMRRNPGQGNRDEYEIERT